jgi:hypothetical protein
VSCGIWLNEEVLGLNKYSLYVLYGEPGVGKTTAALHLVAYDLSKQYGLGHREAFEEAMKRIYMGADALDVMAYLWDAKKHRRKVSDWLILDDAALGFYDLPRKAWAAIMDSLKVARGSLVTRGIVLTTTSRRYLSLRLLDMAQIFYVTREDTERCGKMLYLYKVLNVLAFNAALGRSRAYWETVVERAMAIPVSQRICLAQGL